MKPVIVAVSRYGHLFDSMAGQLTARGGSWFRSGPGERAIAAVDRHRPDLVILDAGNDTDARVLADVDRIKGQCPGIPLFLIARKSSEALAIGALKAGVDDYFKGPWSADDLLDSIERRLSARTGSGDPGRKTDGFSEKMVGRSRIMGDLKELLDRVTLVDSTVLITGETGTGKELAAGLIHKNSARGRHAMVSVNCAALPENLVESELFGYERGAYTGAVAMSRGRFEQAQGGTVFLDEIGDMNPFAQAKILRVIEEKRISRLGGATPIPLDFRLIAATNRDPEALMEDGAFRNDLFYRLNVARVHMPSLREHREDIPLLIEHGIRRLNRQFNRSVKGLKEEVINLLMRYAWPGNVRELMNLLEATYINLPSGKIRLADLPVHFRRNLEAFDRMPDDERARVLAALMETNWNKSTAAKKLNWSRMTLYRKMAKHKIVEKRNHRQRLSTTG
jgi:DNA-binding NtrC family response regulator